MKNFIKYIIVFLLAITANLLFLKESSAEYHDNGKMIYSISNNTFYLRGSVGNIQMLYSDGSTSYTEIRIDGGEHNFFTGSLVASTKIGDVVYETRDINGIRVTLRLSPMSGGNYIKVEYELYNISGYNKNVGVRQYWDTTVAGNDGSPIQILGTANGLRMYSGNSQFTAFLSNSFGVTDVDSFWVGQYNGGRAWNSIAMYYPGYVHQVSDTDAAFQWNERVLAPYSTRTHSVSVGMGSLNEIPQMTVNSPVNGNLHFINDVVVASGSVRDSDVGDTLYVKGSVDNGTEFTIGTMIATGSWQNYSHSYRIPTNIADGTHTISLWVTDSKGATSPVQNRTFNSIGVYTPTGIGIVDITPNDMTLRFDPNNSSNLISYFVQRTYPNVVDHSLGSLNSMKFSNLEVNSLYKYKVRARTNLGDYSAWSGDISKYTLAKTPIGNGYEDLNLVDKSVKLKWDGNGNPTGTNYNYLVKDPIGNVLLSGNTTQQEILVNSLPINKQLILSVRAQNHDGVYTPEVNLGTFYIDTLAPTVPSLVLQNNVWTPKEFFNVTSNGDVGSGVDKVEYRIIGLNDWTAHSQQLMEIPSSMKGMVDIEARVIDKAGNISGIAKVTAKIDGDDPLINIDIDKRPWGTTVTEANLSFSDVLPGSGYKDYRLKITGNDTRPSDLGVWNTANSKKVEFNDDGIYYIHVEVRDIAGRTTFKTFGPYEVDINKPNMPNIILKTTDWHSVGMPFTIVDNGDIVNGSGIKEIQYSVGGRSWVTYPGGEIKIPSDLGGFVEIKARAIDNVGHISDEHKVTAKIDGDDPIITIDKESRLWGNNFTEANLSFKDVLPGSGFKDHRLVVTSSNSKPSDIGTWDTSDSKKVEFKLDGTYYIHVEARDVAGRVVYKSFGPYQVDVTSPNKPTINLSTLDWAPAGVTFTIDDNGDNVNGSGVDRVEYKIEGRDNDWVTYPGGTIEIPADIQGIVNIWSRTIDKVGNISSVDNVQAKIDDIPPVINDIKIITVGDEQFIELDTVDNESGLAPKAYQYYKQIIGEDSKFSKDPSDWVSDNPFKLPKKRGNSKFIYYVDVRDNNNNVSKSSEVVYVSPVDISFSGVKDGGFENTATIELSDKVLLNGDVSVEIRRGNNLVGVLKSGDLFEDTGLDYERAYDYTLTTVTTHDGKRIESLPVKLKIEIGVPQLELTLSSENFYITPFTDEYTVTGGLMYKQGGLVTLQLVKGNNVIDSNDFKVNPFSNLDWSLKGKLVGIDKDTLTLVADLKDKLKVDLYKKEMEITITKKQVSVDKVNIDKYKSVYKIK